MKHNKNHKDPELRIEGIEESELKRNAFSTPDGYFENLTPRIMASVRDSEQKVLTPAIDWRRVLLPSLGIATLLFAFWLLRTPEVSPTTDFDSVLAEMTLEELDQYLSFDAEELLAYQLVEYGQLEFNADVSDQQTLEYLINEEGLDVHAIANELDI